MIDAAKVEAAVAAAVKAERSRALAILTHPEAAGRADLARACVVTGVSVEDAAALMRVATRTAPDAASGPDFATLAQQIRADRAKHASDILAQVAGDAEVATELARQGYAAADVREITTTTRPAA